MRPILAGLSVPRPPRPSASPTSSSSSSSSGTSGGVPREHDHSPQAPVYQPPHVPMMEALRYRSLFGQRRVVPPSPQRDASEPSEEASEEHDDTHTSSDTSHSSVYISSMDASQGSDRESISFDYVILVVRLSTVVLRDVGLVRLFLPAVYLQRKTW
ncbi:hypothetical protein PIB30_062326 [Stylosanthes scabra]|uniref:Uncharacterized protein n=1 Tax=Stylosanthes scabra TaxID=79078 RepID=A0ABU6SM04_9FABA|nr:hypothetical protein [Stylosanthes scabra]